MIILGIGCNIGDRLANLRGALKQLTFCDDIFVIQASPIYESDALLPNNTPVNWNKPYLNLAISIKTSLNPEQLIAKLKAIEKKMGRETKNEPWSPRIIDIDILAWDKMNYHTDTLSIPHIGLLDRPFALWPLSDVAPNWQYCKPNNTATGKTAEELVKKWGSRFDGNAPLRTKQIAHRIDTPLMVGILNITTDSFSDGNNYINTETAINHAENLFNAGADIIDIGAESTRPDAITISSKEEWDRLKPILEAWNLFWTNKTLKPKLSIDTHKPETVEKLLAYEVDFFNDVSGLTNTKMQAVFKEANEKKTKFIFMHNLGIPASTKNTLQKNIDTVTAVYKWAENQLEKIIRFGIKKENLIFDVGIGFGKNAEQSWDLIKNISKFHQLDIPILVGHSRKSFLNKVTNKPFAERDIETAAISSFLATQKVEYLRIHNVDKTMRLLKINKLLSQQHK